MSIADSIAPPFCFWNQAEAGASESALGEEMFPEW